MCIFTPRRLFACCSIFVFLPVQILHHHIASVEKLSLTTTGCPLFIQCRNFRVVHFVVQRERDCHDVYSSLLRLLQPGVFHPCVKVLNSILEGEDAYWGFLHEGASLRVHKLGTLSGFFSHF